MCGISGLFCKSTTASIEGAAVLSSMNDRLQHRGPDGAGLKWFDNTAFGLAHRRLSIIDLSEKAAQPMYLNERYWLSFNGEIYNYLELRTELCALGAVFQSNSDAEVLLQAYIFWGADCLKRFNGMWSFAIYDQEQNTLFCARDPHGVKPFYYLENQTHFGFASEIKALLAIPSHKAIANTKALLAYFGRSKIETETEGFFKNIFELRPGHTLSYDLTSQQKSIAKYYLPTHIEPKQAKDQFKATLENAVTLRLRADVPLGFCLSGGLDSSSLLHLAAKINESKNVASLANGLHAFTAANDSPLDERQWAKQMITHTDSTWHVSELNSQQLIDALPQLIYYQDIPLLSTSTFAQSSVMKSAAQQNIKILIDGQGGDELFAGYQVFYPTFFKELFWTGRWALFLREWSQLGNSPSSKNYILKEWLKDLITYLPNKVQLFIAKRANPSLTYLQQLPDRSRQRFSSLQAHLASYCHEHELKSLLRWEDRCSMQFGIESRTPFADDTELLQTARSLQLTDLIHNGWSKYILRKALDKELPSTISWRRDKKGFSVPESAWLMETAHFWSTQIETHCALDKSELVDHVQLHKDLARIFSHSKYADLQNFVFRYVCYLIWLNEFNIKQFA
ncbi:MAG: asparagine synthase [Bacteroidota bacterium]|jgi:asparagine synthase (glutamine-hydrolysing)